MTDDDTKKDTEGSPDEEVKVLLDIMDYQARTKDLSARVPIKSDSKIGKISRHYNALISEMESLTQELGKHVERRTDQISRINNSLANEVMDRKIAEHALAEALQNAEAANLAKSAFLANMSHELRTPLNSIIGFSEMINQAIFGKIENDRYTDYINAIHISGSHLLTLINDILDLSKIEANSMTLEEEESDVAEIVERSTLLVKNIIENNKLNLVVEIPDNFPKLVCDPLRILQIIVNLLGNAIKFTPEGGEIKLCISQEKNSGITIKVSDNGIGIPEDSLKKIFEPFAQVKDGSTHNIQGTGLGLSLVYALVELHDGRIGIESVEGEGTDIYIFFPPKRTVL